MIGELIRLRAIKFIVITYRHSRLISLQANLTIENRNTSIAVRLDGRPSLELLLLIIFFLEGLGPSNVKLFVNEWSLVLVESVSG